MRDIIGLYFWGVITVSMAIMDNPVGYLVALAGLYTVYKRAKENIGA